MPSLSSSPGPARRRTVAIALAAFTFRSPALIRVRRCTHLWLLLRRPALRARGVSPLASPSSHPQAVPPLSTSNALLLLLPPPPRPPSPIVPPIFVIPPPIRHTLPGKPKKKGISKNRTTSLDPYGPSSSRAVAS
ncbi:hypothetical protein SCP_1800680 [Sparassis crispa]|uniref:Uncharacterized protein n=1 Tax=Sparassis crispa TaxID=139825 RepID=A0A401H6H7_9APHY|nr:hypothetical protein SCP_1800680 [Sparassis crispa]GBE90046.1 hypothetical protein SCP_1800680 [Sparassis crispa]